MAAKTTIRDILITPFEIDVDESNFTLVEITISQGGKVAGNETEAGKKTRKFVGYYSTLGGAINRIMQERTALSAPDLDDKIVDLKTFLARQQSYIELVKKWVNFLGTPFKVTEGKDGVLVISPSKVLKNAQK